MVAVLFDSNGVCLSYKKHLSPLETVYTSCHKY